VEYTPGDRRRQSMRGMAVLPSVMSTSMTSAPPNDWLPRAATHDVRAPAPGVTATRPHARRAGASARRERRAFGVHAFAGRNRPDAPPLPPSPEGRRRVGRATARAALRRRRDPSSAPPRAASSTRGRGRCPTPALSQLPYSFPTG
jgi:hypothetical protein